MVVDGRIKRYTGEVSTKGGLVILRRADPSQDEQGRALWVVRCYQCGQAKVIRGDQFNRLSSCGCSRWKHGAAKKGKVAPLYAAWVQMKQRCQNPRHGSFHRYGGRGIRVCVRWLHDFDAFQRHIGPCPGPGYSIDRIDNDGDYEPGNVRWATRKQQQRNRGRDLTFRGHTRSVPDWADHLGISVVGLKNRLRRGWSVERALTQTVQKKSRS